MNLIGKIQTLLQEAGYYHATIDDIWGAKSQASLEDVFIDLLAKAQDNFQ